jgi:hypothetical protein
MRLRVWRRVRVLPGVTLNIGKRGVSSVSFGRRGMHYTVGRGRERVTVGLPGSGLFLTESRRLRPGVDTALGWVILLVVVALVMMLR